MAAEPQRELPSLSQRDMYPPNFPETATRLTQIACDQKNTGYPLLTAFDTYCRGTLQHIERLPDETPRQYKQRMSWAVQAAAIELLSASGLKKYEERISWKTALTQEILEARADVPNFNLPGILVTFQQSPDSRLDAYSGNRIIINFDNILTPYPRSQFNIHVSGDYHELLQIMDPTILNNQIQHARIEVISPKAWADMLCGELRMLYGILMSIEDDPMEDDFLQRDNLSKAIRNRYSALSELIEKDVTNQLGITVTYSNDKGFSAFSIKPAGMGNYSLRVQPEEVTDTIWSSFIRICQRENPDLAIPSRNEAKPRKKKNSNRRGSYEKPKKREDRWR